MGLILKALYVYVPCNLKRKDKLNLLRCLLGYLSSFLGYQTWVKDWELLKDGMWAAFFNVDILDYLYQLSFLMAFWKLDEKNVLSFGFDTKFSSTSLLIKVS